MHCSRVSGSSCAVMTTIDSSWPLGLQLAQHLQAAHAGHVQVEHHAVGPPRGGGVEELLAVGVALGLQAGGAQQAAERFADPLLVIHDRDGRHARDWIRSRAVQ